MLCFAVAETLLPWIQAVLMRWYENIAEKTNTNKKLTSPGRLFLFFIIEQSSTLGSSTRPLPIAILKQAQPQQWIGGQRPICLWPVATGTTGMDEI